MILQECQRKLFHCFFLSWFKFVFFALQEWDWEEYHGWLTDYSTTEIQTTLPSSKWSLSSGILVALLCYTYFFVCNTFFCLRRFVWMCFLFVGYIEETGNKSYFSTQYTTVYVVLISSLSRSIRMVPIVWVWVWGIWDCVFSGCFFFPSGACQHYKWVIQSAQKLGSLTPLVA